MIFAPVARMRPARALSDLHGFDWNQVRLSGLAEQRVHLDEQLGIGIVHQLDRLGGTFGYARAAALARHRLNERRADNTPHAAQVCLDLGHVEWAGANTREAAD